MTEVEDIRDDTISCLGEIALAPQRHVWLEIYTCMVELPHYQQRLKLFLSGLDDTISIH